MLTRHVAAARSLLEAPSGGTIKIRGLEYSWEPTKNSKDEDAYIIKGKKGADYMTMRNVHTPEHMFIISRKAFGTPKGMKGVWLTDKNGMLEVVKD